MSIDWVFPSSNGGSDDGFNDAGIETFTGARYDGLAREIIQNSLDAAEDDDTKVTVEFDFIKISREQFPGADALLEVMKKCKQGGDAPKEQAFFETAVAELNKADICCLKISDSGTTGLRGDYRQRKGQWHAITKARGVSDKNDPAAGGSYGIGKNAPFTVSLLRTVFYSTMYEKDDGLVYLAQGKSILKSHSTDDGGYTQATGFYGNAEGCMPIENDIPDILRPQQQGCVVFIPGFVAEDKWQHKIMTTVVTNFFCAIDQEKLEVSIRDEKRNTEQICKESLDECFQKIKNLEISPEKVENSLHYYKTIKTEDYKEAQLRLLGHCKMWVRVGEGLPKRVALVRKTGMLITDEQLGLKRWAGRADFVGVFMCDSPEGNCLLREIENPQHNAFELERAIPAKHDECERALKELIKWVRACVDELAKPKETEVEQLDELNQFFPDNDPPETIPGDDGERDIEGKPVYSPKPLKRAKVKSDGEEGGGDEGGAGEESGNGGDESGDRHGHGAGTGGSGTRKPKQAVEIRNVRVVSDTAGSKNKTIYFTPMKSGTIKVTLVAMGDDGGLEKIAIDATEGISDSTFSVTVKRNKRVMLKAVLKQPMNDSIAVRAFQKKGDSDDETTAK